MSNLPQISVNDVKGVYAYLPTPIRKDLVMDRHVKNAVDLDEAARATDVLINDGAAGIVLNGTFGEVPSLTLDEILDLTRAVVEAANGRVPIFGGPTTLNIRDTISRSRAMREIGVQGLNVGRGMMSALGDPNIVQWYRDIVEEFPDMAIILYDDPEAFKRPLTSAVYAELSKMPQIVAAKYRTRLLFSAMAANTYESDLEACEGKIKLMTNETEWWLVHRHAGTDAIWSGGMAFMPGTVMAMQNAVLAGDYESAKAINKDIAWASDGMVPKQGFETWHIDKISVLKKRIDTVGYIKAGPTLPPYHIAPKERIDAGIACGLRDIELQKKYPHKTLSDTLSDGMVNAMAVAAE